MRRSTEIYLEMTAWGKQGMTMLFGRNFMFKNQKNMT